MSIELIAADEIAVELPTAAVTALGVAITVYLIVLAGLSIFAGRKVETEEDYLVAGRKLPLYLCWATMIATWFGAEAMTASSENARHEGLLGVVLDPLACAATFIFTGIFLAAPLWRMKLVTTGDFFRRTYGESAEVLSSLIQIPSYFGWIALQYQALADVQRIYFKIPHQTGIFIAWGITLVYTMLGGMWSVTLIESVQILIALAGLIMLGYSTFSQFGHGSVFAGVERLLAESDPQALTLMPPLATAAMLSYFGAWGTGILGNAPGQDIQQRVFSAKDAQTAVRACWLTGITYFVFGMIPVSIGLVSRIVLPDAPATGTLQLMVNRYLSSPLAVFFLLAFTSMVISTSTSAILAPATVLSHSLLGRLKMFHNSGLLLDRLSVLLISLGGLSLTFLEQTKMQLLDLAISMTLVALFVPMWAGLYGRPRSVWSGILSMTFGITLFMIRWLPENVFLPMPENLQITAKSSVDYHDYVAYALIDQKRWVALHIDWKTVAELPKLSQPAERIRNLLIVPADWYGVAASVAGYFLGQLWFRRQPPINSQTLHDAWGAR